MKRTVVKTILFGLTHVLRRTAKKYPAFREHMRRGWEADPCLKP